MSVLFGMAGLELAASGRLQLRLQAAQHQMIETFEQWLEVVRARARLRVALEAERRLVFQRDSLQRAIEQRAVSGSHVRRQSAFVHGEPVILTRDEYPSRVQILHGMIRAVMTELHLEGARTR